MEELAWLTTGPPDRPSVISTGTGADLEVAGSSSDITFGSNQ